LPEAGQGALALQVRVGEGELVAGADDPETRRRVEAERAVVFAIGGGCLAPVAAHHDGETLTALVADEDGAWIERRSGDDPTALAAELTALAQNRRSRHTSFTHPRAFARYREFPPGWVGVRDGSRPPACARHRDSGAGSRWAACGAAGSTWARGRALPLDRARAGRPARGRRDRLRLGRRHEPARRGGARPEAG